MITRVVNKHRHKYDVYIGRGSKWGNPYIMNRDGTREEVIEKYRSYLYTQREDLLFSLHELRDKILGCFCAPNACHGDVLIELLESGDYDVNTEDELDYPDAEKFQAEADHRRESMEYR